MNKAGKNRFCSNGLAGFGLLELLVACGLGLLILAMMPHLLGMSRLLFSQAREEQVAWNLARGKMEEVLISSYEVCADFASSPGGADWWSRALAGSLLPQASGRVSVSEEPANLKTVEVTVSWLAGRTGRNRDVRLISRKCR